MYVKKGIQERKRKFKVRYEKKNKSIMKKKLIFLGKHIVFV